MVYDSEKWGLWCHTDYEANQILKQLGIKGDGKDLLGGIVEVRGSQPISVKEERLRSFTNGISRAILTKPSIGGYGLNWQHCHNLACFASFSYEDWYQLIRRFLRYGQQSPFVNAHIVMSENEIPIFNIVKEKEHAHKQMQLSMSGNMSRFTQANLYSRPVLRQYLPEKLVNAPQWLVSRN